MEKNTQHRINLDSILYVRTNRRYTTMYAGKKLYHFDATLEELMADPSLDCLVGGEAPPSLTVSSSTRSRAST